MTAPTVVRTAGSPDREQVWALARDLATSYEVDLDAFTTTFDQLTSAPDVLVLVADNDGRIDGYLMGQRHHTFHANGPVVWVEEVMVAAEQRGTGIGRALMNAAERWAREQNATYVALATRRAAEFYTALGYEPSATYFKRPV